MSSAWRVALDRQTSGFIVIFDRTTCICRSSIMEIPEGRVGDSRRIVVLPDNRIIQIVMDRKEFNTEMTRRIFESPPYAIDQ